MELSPLPLGYARLRRRRGAAVWRRLGIAGLVLAAAIVLMRFGGPVWSEFWHRRALANALYWQEQCMACDIPAGTVVYQEGPGAAEVARQAGHRLEMTQAADLFPDDRWGPFFCATYHSQSWTRFNDALCNASAMVGAPGRSILFLHARRSPIGNVRLVMVEFCPVGFGWLRANVVIPGTRQSPADMALTAATLSVRRSTEHDVLQILAGQPDATDPSHFSLDCKFNDKPCVIDGYLKDDDRLRLTPRSGKYILSAGGAEWWPDSN